MTNSDRDIHIHVTPQPGSTVYVSITSNGVAVTADEVDTASESTSTDAAIEAGVQRLESSQSSPNVREAFDGLRALGYEFKLPKTDVPGKRPENYLRIMDPRYTAHGVGYLTPTYFSFSRASDRELLEGLPEAEVRQTDIKFSHVESARYGLRAAELLMGSSVPR
jgi:hypothetical protein